MTNRPITIQMLVQEYQNRAREIDKKIQSHLKEVVTNRVFTEARMREVEHLLQLSTWLHERIHNPE